MIVSAAVLPHPPLLLRELGGGHDSVPALREAARTAVQRVTEGAERVVVVGGHDQKPSWSMGWPAAVRGYGPSAASAGVVGVPLSIGVGLRLLEDVGWRSDAGQVALGWDEEQESLDALAEELAEDEVPTALLLLGDGSARRGEKAPGYLDDRAFPFDDRLGEALRSGDARTLRDLDADLAAELMVQGRAAFRLLGTVALDRPATATLLHRSDPFGVSYFVATWLF